MTKEVPKGWQTLPLGKIGRFINGRAFKPSEWSTTGFPIIRIQNLTETSKIFNYFDDEVSEKHLVKRGDLLISWSASLGIFQWKGPDAVLNQHIFKAIPDNEIINDKYFYYCMKTKIDQMGKDTHGSTMKHIVKGDFNRTLIPVPPLETQQKIVAILDKAEEIKRLRAEANAQSQKLIQSVFLDMFGDPVKNPKKWGLKKLSELIDSNRPITYGIVQPGNEVPTGIPIIRPIDIINDLVDKNKLKKVSIDIERAYPRSRLRGRELLISIRGTIGLVTLTTEELYGCNISRGIAVISYNEKINPHYLLSFFKNESVQRLIQQLSKGSGLKGFNLKDLKNFEIPLPPLEMQQIFQNIVEIINTQCFLNISMNNNIELLFNSIITKSFSGELVA